MKITKKTAILLAAVMLVSVVTAVTVFAYPMGIGKERGHIKSFGQPLLMGHGFALNGNEYHILDVNAMMVNEKRNNTQMSTWTTGHLRFAGQAYSLNVTSYDNQSLKGDVLTLPPRGTNQTGFTPATVGHISLSMSKYEGTLLSTGTLTMNNTNYNVLLTSPVIASGAGQRNFNGTIKQHSLNATFRKGNFNGTFKQYNSNGMFGRHNSKR
jgi:hypothetical protein